MSTPARNPTRLCHVPDADDPHGLGQLFCSALDLPDEDLPMLMWRVRVSQRLCVTRPSRILRVALVATVLFSLGGVVGAVVAVRPYWRRPQTTPPALGAKPVASEPRKARKPSVLAPAPLPAAPEAVPEEARPVPPAVKHPTARRVAALTPGSPAPEVAPPPELAPPAPVPSPIAVEQDLLDRALSTLRDRHDAEGALSLVAEHHRQFPAGALRSEAAMLRVEALLALGRRSEALAILDQLPFERSPNRDEQVVVRGELRAAAGRWREARDDFDKLLAAHALPAASSKVKDLQERALWGRAAARSRLHDESGSRADLALYLRLFPAGRFAGPAAALLRAAP